MPLVDSPQKLDDDRRSLLLFIVLSQSLNVVMSNNKEVVFIGDMR